MLTASTVSSCRMSWSTAGTTTTWLPSTLRRHSPSRAARSMPRRRSVSAFTWDASCFSLQVRSSFGTCLSAAVMHTRQNALDLCERKRASNLIPSELCVVLAPPNNRLASATTRTRRDAATFRSVACSIRFFPEIAPLRRPMIAFAVIAAARWRCRLDRPRPAAWRPLKK